MAAPPVELPPDPAFAAKAARVLDLYQHVFDGAPLAADQYLISAEEKTQLQARCRCHPPCRLARPG